MTLYFQSEVELQRWSKQQAVDTQTNQKYMVVFFCLFVCFGLGFFLECSDYHNYKKMFSFKMEEKLRNLATNILVWKMLVPYSQRLMKFDFQQKL